MKDNYNFIKYRMITVTDDWHPCFSNNQVRVSLSMFNILDRHYCLLNAWGADDFGVEKSFLCGSKKENEAKFVELEKEYNAIPNVADKNWFFENGFEVC